MAVAFPLCLQPSVQPCCCFLVFRFSLEMFRQVAVVSSSWNEPVCLGRMVSGCPYSQLCLWESEGPGAEPVPLSDAKDGFRALPQTGASASASLMPLPSCKSLLLLTLFGPGKPWALFLGLNTLLGFGIALYSSHCVSECFPSVPCCFVKVLSTLCCHCKSLFCI